MIIAILLDGNKDNIYDPGQNVSGHIRVETNEEIKMRGVRFEVHGDGRVYWSTGSGSNKRTYRARENYFELITYLTGSGDKDSEMILQPGVYTYPISFVLPENIPASFEGFTGSIRYKVQAIVDRPWKIDDSAEILLTVVRCLDLNHEPPQLMEPIVAQEDEPMVGCFQRCCIKGLPDMELRINRGCFAPEETIVVSGQVINKSNTKIKQTTINFMQEIQFFETYSNGEIYRKRRLYETLGSTKRPEIEIGCTDTWSGVTFTVPSVVASRLDLCKIINLSYLILMKAEFARGYAEIAILKEIIIRHIPLQGNSQFGGPIMTQPSLYTSPFQCEFSEQSNYSAVHGAEGNQDNSATFVGDK